MREEEGEMEGEGGAREGVRLRVALRLGVNVLVAVRVRLPLSDGVQDDVTLGGTLTDAVALAVAGEGVGGGVPLGEGYTSPASPPLYASRLVVPTGSPEMEPAVAAPSSTCAACAAVDPAGIPLQMVAATPDTMGAAKDVPSPCA